MTQAVCIALALGLLPAARTASAFQILTPATSACHESILLGALGATDSAWDLPANPEVARAIDVLRRRAQAMGVPSDPATQAFVQDVVTLYGVHAEGALERWLFASFVAGLREPDTAGLSIVRFNDGREIHLHDDGQAAHSLRRSSYDGAEGNRAALQEIRAALSARLEAAVQMWARPDASLARGAAWTLPHYGEFTVRVFDPAFRIGEMVHALQDSYAHMVRDEQLRVLSVGNFVEAVAGTHCEERDGIAHSERMDRCDLHDAFDGPRVVAARRATADWITASVGAFESGGTGAGTEPILDRVYEPRTECTFHNDYCQTSWLPFARTDPTQPVRLFFCSASPKGPRSASWLLLLACCLALLARGRSRVAAG